MKNIILFLICVCLFSACQEEPKNIHISGTVTNNTKDYALFVKDTTEIGLSTVIDTITIDENGHFDFIINPLKSNSLFFSTKKNLLD